MMSFGRMRWYVDVVLSAFPNSIKLLALSGGECFMLGWRLFAIILYGHLRGLAVRVVSNGSWATSLRRAYWMMRLLKWFGLTEINFSTGTEHQEWVPVGRIVNACIAAYRIGMRCLVNVETSIGDVATSDTFEQIPEIKSILAKQEEEKGRTVLSVVHGVWMASERENEPLPTSESVESLKQISVPSYGKACDSLFTAITVDVRGYVPACCGLTSAHNPYLRIAGCIGNAAQLKQQWESQYSDLLKVWLATEGAYSILEFAYAKRGEGIPKEYASKHMCELCKEIYRAENLALLRAHASEVKGRIFMKERMSRRFRQLMSAGGCAAHRNA